MVDNEAASNAIVNFNMAMVRTEMADDFDKAITILCSSRKEINKLQNLINQMKQEEHDLTQDIYNKFKDKGYVKSIKFV